MNLNCGNTDSVLVVDLIPCFSFSKYSNYFSITVQSLTT